MNINPSAGHLGKRVESRTSYIIEDKTVKNEPVVKLDYDKDFKVGEDDPAIVVKKRADDGKTEWQPVKDANEFKELFNKADLEEKRENFGLWLDAKRWVVFGKDGETQDKEVTTFGRHWDKYEFHSEDKLYGKEGAMEKAWVDNFTQVAGKNALVTKKDSPNGKIYLLDEPQRITKREASAITMYGLYPKVIKYTQKL